jgi:hypothetical protein
VFLMSYCQEFGLKKNCLYEIIATTFSITNDGKQIKPNASCMGIRIVETEQIQITPFYSTTTYKNLKENSIIAINFIDNVYLYALAALKEKNSVIGLDEFPAEYYRFKHVESLTMDVPYVKEAWGVIIGKVLQEFQHTKHDALGEVMIPIFKLDVILNEKFRSSFKLFNRAENLALETIVLATKLKIAKKKNDNRLGKTIQERINDHINDINKFGQNENALKSIELVDKYIRSL